MKEALIIFVRNPRLGKVKTRIAKSVGDKRALAIYQQLLTKTLAVASPWKGDKFVFYDQFIDQNDQWPNSEFFKRLQIEGDLGLKMYTALEELFNHYDKLVIIGSDCYQLTTTILNTAFIELSKKDVVIGPSSDGGYYLIGMRSLCKELFEHIPWSTSQVLDITLKKIYEKKLSYSKLGVLKDVDYYEDWVEQTQIN